MVYVILLNGKVVGTAKNYDKAEKLKSFAEKCCQVISETTGNVVSWVIDVEFWNEFD